MSAIEERGSCNFKGLKGAFLLPIKNNMASKGKAEVLKRSFDEREGGGCEEKGKRGGFCILRCKILEDKNLRRRGGGRQRGRARPSTWRRGRV